MMLGTRKQHCFHTGNSMVASSMSACNHKLILKPPLECLSMTNTQIRLLTIIQVCSQKPIRKACNDTSSYYEECVFDTRILAAGISSVKGICVGSTPLPIVLQSASLVYSAVHSGLSRQNSHGCYLSIISITCCNYMRTCCDGELWDSCPPRLCPRAKERLCLNTTLL